MIIENKLLYLKPFNECKKKASFTLHPAHKLIERLCNAVMIGNFDGSKLSKAQANFKEN